MQYEPGVLEACLKLLEVSPQHFMDKDEDYMRRADPVYLSRVICAMVRDITCFVASRANYSQRHGWENV